MSTTSTPSNVVPLRTEAEAESPFDQLWGSDVRRHGYTAVPTMLVRAQHRLQLKPTAFCVLIQLIEHWRTRDRVPYPTKQQLADRIGVSQSTIQQTIRKLEKAGLVQRVQHKTASGDWGANTYHLDGLVKKLKEIEPDFAKEKEERAKARKRVEVPKRRIKPTPSV
ncbi:helix-turn-helix domain-containing protein [Aureimonas sp. N4]|uniref:helix-turn-helix domain-containing protein n=1 Tax=Aureimonas sp. N4 TaxID=1638165 RepID=UPI000AA709FF|nr:helix-turn-helix domain-containing protein [Aureimonas sp. N4]